MIPISKMRDRLRDAVEMAGGQRAWARQTNIPQPVISDVLSGKIDPPPESVINALGYIVQEPMCVPFNRGRKR